VEADAALGQAHINLIGVYARLGDFAAADAAFGRAMQIEGGRAEALYNHGVSLAARDRFEEAARQFEAALERNPHYADAHHNLGYALQAMGKRKEAEVQFRLALAAAPQHREAHFALARLLGSAGGAEAEEHYRRAIAVDDERSAAYRYYLADFYHRAGRGKEAMEQARAALELAERYEKRELAGYLADLLRSWERGR
jgi:Tfp pilus assembly protein PilF